MEINRNKLIFYVVLGIVLLSIIFLFLALSSDKNGNSTSSTGNVKIWFVGESFNSSELITSFKEAYSNKYKNSTITFEIFPNFEDYTYTLASAINSGVGPDIFVLNNNEKNSIFTNQIAGILDSKVSPNDFRKKYEVFFADDLIESYSDGTTTKEHLIGMPVGYETLGIYYNFQKVKDTDLDNLSSLNNTIASLKNDPKNRGAIPIGIGNGGSVFDSADIITQFFMLNGAKSTREVSGNALKEGMASYLSYGDVSGINGYNSKSLELKSTNKTSVDLFVKGEVYMVVGYPSLVNRIKEAGGFSKSLLRVRRFPHYFAGGGDTLVNYNYFVINKSTPNMEFAQDFLTYLGSNAGATKFLDLYPYYLPGLVELEDNVLSKKIAPNDFNVTLGDFYDDSFTLSSFDKLIKNVYDEKITLFLDNTNYQEDLFNRLRDSIVCKWRKMVNFENLSSKCE